MRQREPARAYFFFFTITALTIALPAQVSPVDRANLEGSSSSTYPLGRWNARVQQLHADLGTQARAINGHAYRRDAAAVRGQVPAFKTELEIELSLSTLTPDQASSQFGMNTGANRTVVLPRSWISFPATDRPADAPAPTFDLQIPYQQPFQYPSGGGVLCVDMTVHGNDRASGRNTNFDPEVDAHEVMVNGVNDQPGYRFGQGCPASGNTAPGYATFTLRRLPTGTHLMVAARNGMATDASGPGFSAVLLGLVEANTPWHLRPDCTRLTTIDAAFMLPGANDTRGNWDGTVKTGEQLPAGLHFVVQIASVHAQNGTALGDGSRLVVPPPGPSTQTVARIANGTDRTSPTGTVSNIVPVTLFF